MSDLWEEYANTCDNIGRVYTQLYQRGPAEEWMDRALEMRLKLGDEYRIALSLRLQAILYLTFGLPERAYHLASEALYICQRLEKQRGTGLACITLGSARRQMANLSIIYSYEQRAKFLEEAEWYLHQAKAIFGDSVAEPVRLLEAQYELLNFQLIMSAPKGRKHVQNGLLLRTLIVENSVGCVYRDWAALVCHEGADPALAAKYERFAVWHLQFTVGLAHDSRPLWYVDACLALVQTYLQCRQFDAAQEWLGRANRAIPSMYTLQADGSLAGIPVEERIEGFWYRMGEIELLRGHLACDRELVNGQRQLSRGGLPCSRGLVARPMLVR
jgi:tetratricopeptide (TPR) repeat protein